MVGRSLSSEEDAQDVFASINSIILTGSLLVLLAIGYRVNTHRLRSVPESGAAIALGFVVGLAVRLFHLHEEEEVLDFRGEFFFFVLLPPIIFEAGLSLKTQIFVDNLGAIVAFAVFGTVVSTWVVSTCLLHVAKAGLVGLVDTPHLALNCQLFGALISATDPVATIALFGGTRFRADPLLHSLINGESVLNDAVAIVLFSALRRHAHAEETRIVSVSVLGHFFTVGAGSVLVGLAAGVLCSWCFCQASLLRRFPDYEVAAMCLSAYLTFALSQLLGLSGIVTLFFFGVLLAQYNWYNLSEPAKVASKVTFGTLAKLAESCVFVYLGIVSALSLGRYHWHLGLVLFVSFIIAVARAAHVFPFTMILNLGRRQKIHRNMSIMLWASGLRGAIAFALALRIPCASGHFDRRGTPDCRNSDLLVTSTISVVVLTTLVVGSAMEQVATALQVIEPAGGALTNGEGDDSLSVPLAATSVGANADSGQENFERRVEATPIDRRPGGVDCASCERGASGAVGGGGQDPKGTGVVSRNFWYSSVSAINARGWFYQAFAQFDMDVLQPRLGGPNRVRAGIGGNGDLAATEMNSLQGYSNQAGWTSLDEDDPPPWSRACIFE